MNNLILHLKLLEKNNKAQIEQKEIIKIRKINRIESTKIQKINEAKSGSLKKQKRWTYL